jgi:hypothetical protein
MVIYGIIMAQIKRGLAAGRFFKSGHFQITDRKQSDSKPPPDCVTPAGKNINSQKSGQNGQAKDGKSAQNTVNGHKNPSKVRL